jgi:tetratricopeptide (TPR) repeat protein
MMADAKQPTALISYSHDSPEHEQRVLELCNRLRARGIDAFVDQFLPGAPSEGWPLWMERQIESRDFTLMVCTEAYRQRFMEEEASGIGRGVVWEARILRNLLYEDSERHSRIVPVLIESGARPFVPTVFRSHFYDLSDERGFESLLRHLLREPGAEVGALGSLGPQGSRWSAFERPWLVPDAMRTHYFTGRENLLALLRQQLLDRRRAALSGLGGVGKTQSAIEYAVGHREDYPDGVFWVNAETTSGLTGGFVEIAKTLRLAAAASSDQEHVVQAVLEWLNGTDDWLLIFDNVDDRGGVAPFLPQRGKGHILITSRESVFQEIGIARALEVVDLDGDEAARFLLKRTGRDESDPQERTAVTALADELGNLPLALEQAAAYITETNASFSDYLTSFRKRRVALLEKGGEFISHETVAVTWAANFEAVERTSPAAADVLRISAFLAPDAIPFDVFYKGAPALSARIAAALPDPEDTLAVGELLRPLARYSLIRSDAKLRAYGMHRLVQEIVRASIAESERRTWVERAVVALNAALPEVEYATWAQCDRLVPHVRTIAEWIGSYDVRLEDAARVLNETGQYLDERGRYTEAEPLLERALAIRKRVLGPDHPDVARSLSSLAEVNWNQGRYAEAQPLVERALAIREAALGPDHPDVAYSLNNLANLYRQQSRHAEAEPVYERSLAIRERALGPDHQDVADVLIDLALVYRHQGHSVEAQSLNERALATWERAFGPDHPKVAVGLNNLAAVYNDQGRYAEAEPLCERALAIWERALGPDHARVAWPLENLAFAYFKQGRYAEAEPLWERALAIRERALGPDHLDVAPSLNGLANVYLKQGRYAEAEPLHERSLAIREAALGPDHPDVAYSLSHLANVYLKQGRFVEARALHERALAIRERAHPLVQAGVAHSLNNLANVYLKQGRFVEAQPLFERALAIREPALGPDHPDVAESLVGLASLRQDQGRNAEAVPFFERALAIKKRTLAEDHPELAEIRSNLDALRAAITLGEASSADTATPP